MELDDRLTFILLQRFDRRTDELSEFDPGLVQYTKTQLLDQKFVKRTPKPLRGDDEVKEIAFSYELTTRGGVLFQQLKKRLGK
jgi:hypothetical protein